MSGFGMVAPSSGQVGAEGEGRLIAIGQLELAHPLGGFLTAEDTEEDLVALFGAEVLAVPELNDLSEGPGDVWSRRLLLRGAGFEDRHQRHRGQGGERLAELAPRCVGACIDSRSIHCFRLWGMVWQAGYETDPIAAIIPRSPCRAREAICSEPASSVRRGKIRWARTVGNPGKATSGGQTVSTRSRATMSHWPVTRPSSMTWAKRCIAQVGQMWVGMART